MSGDFDIPEYGAVFTFGRSCFADNQPSHFYIKNDPVRKISCGDEHTALICQNGRVFVFGHNDYGQLGLGHTRTMAKPSCLKYLKPFKANNVACGKGHTLVSTECNRLFAFGSNSEGQLGLGDLIDRHTPHSLELEAILNGGAITQVAAGCLHSAFMTDLGDVFTWGSNSDGQCGQGEDIQFLKPVKLNFHSPVGWLSCGYYHSAIICNQEIYTFGEGDSGKLGLGNEDTQSYPQYVQVEAPFKVVECGGSHTVALTESGEVYVFGSNFSGQLGLGNATLVNLPKRLQFHTAILTVSCGESHTVFLTESGDVYCCGDARHGKLGVFEEGLVNVVEPTMIGLLSQQNIMLVTCGGCHTMLVGRPRNSSSDTDIVCQIQTELPPLKFRRGTVEERREDFRDNLSSTESDIQIDTNAQIISGLDDEDVNLALVETKKLENWPVEEEKRMKIIEERKKGRIRRFFERRRQKSASGELKNMGNQNASAACAIL